MFRTLGLTVTGAWCVISRSYDLQRHGILDYRARDVISVVLAMRYPLSFDTTQVMTPKKSSTSAGNASIDWIDRHGYTLRVPTSITPSQEPRRSLSSKTSSRQHQSGAFKATASATCLSVECLSSSECNPKCCTANNICSMFDGLSVPATGDCFDDCECEDNWCNGGTCEKCMAHNDCNTICCLSINACSHKENFVNPGEECLDDCECFGNKCCTGDWLCSILDKASVPDGGLCFDDCECMNGDCIFDTNGENGLCATPTPAPICPPGTDICNDPHLKGLRGQHIEVAGVDGAWYCLVKDPEIDIHVNVRFTAPLPVDFPHRQLITGISLLSNEHSLVIEAKNPYDTTPNGCTDSSSPCLVDGGLRIAVDGQPEERFLHPTRDMPVFDYITLSASNLPMECRQFGNDKIWARMYDEMLRGQRQLRAESFEDWMLRFDTMAAHDWCTKYIAERGLDHVQSNHGVFKITTPTVVIRLNAGINHQEEGEHDWDGRTLPDLDFWQMDVGFEGLVVDHAENTGILGETARPVLNDQGYEVMSGDKALHGTVEDYHVSGPLGTNFALIEKKLHQL